ncbi:carbohydrate ABC transporter permease [Microbacterium sp. KSW4-16]|uniref:Carbohydrate ABC transporter permease n=1 Tax=Microbacterium aurugineum TaxID=2851642 RepID=A0ABY4IW20_9MICO|nr:MULTISPECIES: carbohydrate ABC transporter permease [Microbacterium]PKQ34987.1 MAG: carbohydrate ABC transporter permease [Actinobacteria bacterium HGW-Actinobacteria-11]MCK8468399.1 carbohydrate ABC transporter permease [Microbacterium aurugineum]MCZ4301650.1 carbohydrate ABC transporter permease [Microbacterium oxydans]QEA27132.1 carbohydrate ABC transporter permease [Microbacterium sp. CBA3102]TCJ28646.1 carbohydrate ABC transporter permease [Microbacterium sp. PI-1]
MTDTVKSDAALSTRAITTGGGFEGAAGRTRKKLSRPWASVASIVIAFMWTIPTLGLFISSFRPRDQIQTTGWWTFFADPQVTIENYVDVLQSGTTQLTILESFVNSIAITIPATIVPLMIASMAAYAFAWIDFKGRNALFIFVFALQIVPIQMALVPLLSSFSRGLNLFGLQVTLPLDASQGYAQVWIAHSMFALPLAIYLLHNFMSEIPGEIIEAARVDGASRGQIFFRVVLPLTMPAIASVAIFQFLWVWNDLLVALVFADGAAAPITKLLAEITGTRGNDWYLLTAGAFVSIIVPLIVFFALQRYFVRGLLAGSTKG